MTVIQLDLDLRLEPGRTSRREFHEQIARLERELAHTLTQLDAAHRPPARVEADTSAPRILTGAELEVTRDALLGRLSDAQGLVDRQSADRGEAQALLKRMSDAPEHFRWATVTTKELGVEGCRTWQSVPVLGPIGMLGNWWRIRMSSGCP
ncbi:MAG: hypothetical protein ACJ71Z_12990 [Aeromicrobium sp.]